VRASFPTGRLDGGAGGMERSIIMHRHHLHLLMRWMEAGKSKDSKKLMPMNSNEFKFDTHSKMRHFQCRKLLPFEPTKNLSWAILITRKAQIQTRPTDPI